MPATDSELEPCAHLCGDRIKGGDDPFVVAGIPDHHCRTVLPITLIQQYRFATPNPLKTRSLESLHKGSFTQSHPLCKGTANGCSEGVPGSSAGPGNHALGGCPCHSLLLVIPGTLSTSASPAVRDGTDSGSLAPSERTDSTRSASSAIAHCTTGPAPAAWVRHGLQKGCEARTCAP